MSASHFRLLVETEGARTAVLSQAVANVVEVQMLAAMVQQFCPPGQIVSVVPDRRAYRQAWASGACQIPGQVFSYAVAGGQIKTVGWCLDPFTAERKETR